jgi:capsular polysaccharide biosynthesis protein
MVSVFSPSDKEFTCIINIEVTTESAQKSYDIASAICKYGAVEIPRITESGQVNFIDLPSIETSPVNSRFSASKILLAAVGVPALVYAFLIVLRIFNDRINNTTDAQSQLDLSVLGVIPNLNGDHRKKRYGKKRGYGKYAPYGPYGPYHQNPANRSRD